MNKTAILFLSMLFAVSASAQEYSTREVKIIEGTPVTIGTGAPIDVTKDSSKVWLKYRSGYKHYFSGDYLTRIVFIGYNPGKELERHLTVEVSPGLGGAESNFTTVFDGDCIIPQGGSADACIPMVTIDFAEPLRLDIGDFHVKMTCTGNAVETPVYFEMKEDEYSNKWPTLLLTIQSEVTYFDGTIADQDGTPVKGAAVTVYNDLLSFDATSGDNGRFSVRVGDNNGFYRLTAKAPGFPDYETGSFYVKEVSRPSSIAVPAPENIVIPNRLDFYAGQQATIILPEAPNPAWGRYYRLDRHEGRDIIFVQESEPKADTPYIIFPYEDFSIGMADYNLAQREEPQIVPFPDTESSGHTGFYGSYKSQLTTDMLYDGEFVHIIDTTPDCITVSQSLSLINQRIGACRAYLVLGTYNKEMKYEGPRYVFIDESSGISDKLTVTKDHITYFDLQGRCINGKPEKGIYIQNGKKRVVK